jgi:hypothetical protein
VNVWSVEYEQFEEFVAVEDFQDPEQFPELIEGKSLLYSRLSYYNMHFNYIVFTYCFALILRDLLLRFDKFCLSYALINLGLLYVG